VTRASIIHRATPNESAVRLHSINPIERVNGEIKRRTEVVDIFPNEDAIARRRAQQEHMGFLDGP
jgi:transposase-like protein